MSTGHHEASWRLPESRRRCATADIAHYQRAGPDRRARPGSTRVFFADSPVADDATPPRRPAEALEPTLLLAAMAVVTERIGLIATASTTYEEPYNLARTFASLDVLSHGRAGWNIVTTRRPRGRRATSASTRRPAHAERYARAEEFLEVVIGLWDGWEDDAVVADKASGVFTSPRPGAHARPRRARTSPVARPAQRGPQRAGPPGRSSRPARRDRASRSPRRTPRPSSPPSRRSRRARRSTPSSRRPCAGRPQPRPRQDAARHRARPGRHRGGGPRARAPARRAASCTTTPLAQLAERHRRSRWTSWTSTRRCPDDISPARAPSRATRRATSSRWRWPAAST